MVSHASEATAVHWVFHSCHFRGKAASSAASPDWARQSNQGSCLPTRTVVTGRHLNCQQNLAFMAKVGIVPRAKHDPHSSHLHHSTSCNLLGICLTTPTIILVNTLVADKATVNTGPLQAMKILCFDLKQRCSYVLSSLSQSCRNLTAHTLYILYSVS